MWKIVITGGRSLALRHCQVSRREAVEAVAVYVLWHGQAKWGSGARVRAYRVLHLRRRGKMTRKTLMEIQKDWIYCDFWEFGTPRGERRREGSLVAYLFSEMMEVGIMTH